MARIALAVGIGIAGALTGGLAAAGFGIFSGTFAGGSILGGVLLGGSLGISAGQVLGSLFLPPHSSSSGPRLQDGQISSSAEGAPIPFGYGGFRLGGQIIWSSGIQETKTTTTQSAKGGPTQTTTSYSYTVSFAAAFCEADDDRPASITRIWGDSKLIYDATSKGSVTSNKLATGIGNNTVVITPVIYSGVSSQQPDPTIQAKEGIGATPAFRGLCYLVYTDFPLANFGNRLPNIRAEISMGTVDAFLRDVYPPSGIIDPYVGTGPAIETPVWCFIDQVNRAAYVYDLVGGVVQRIDLNADNRSPLDSWQVSNVTKIADQILGSNGTVQCCISVTSDAKTGTVEPTWTAIFADQITDHHVTWQNIGEGPEAIAITAQGVLNPKLTGAETVVAFPGNPAPSGCGVDTGGYIWQSCFLNPAQPVTGFTCRMVRFDPRTFNAIGQVFIEGNPTNIAFQKTKAGIDLLCVTTTTSVDPFLHFIDGKKCRDLGICRYHKTFTSGGAIALDNNEVAYVLTEDGSTPWNFEIAEINGRSGVPTPVFHAFAGDPTVQEVKSLLYNESDHTLIVFAANGYIVKIDIATWSVVATSAVALLFVGSGYYPQNLSMMYPSGQVPSDGIMRLATHDGSGNNYIALVSALTLAQLDRILITEWTPGVNGQILFQSFDVQTNSLLVTLQGSFPSSDGFTYRLYLDRRAVAGESLDSVVLDLLERGGVDSADTSLSALSSITVKGYPIARNPDVKSSIAPLTMAYLFDLVESDNKVKAVLRGGSSTFNIPESDLGLLSDNFAVIPNIAQQHDLPKTLEVIYADPAKDYQSGKQQRQRNARVKKTKNKTTLQLPLVLEADEAARLAAKALQTIWDERNPYQFKVWRASYLIQDPSDVGQFTYKGKAYVVRLVKNTMGQDLTLSIEAVSEDARNYNSSIAGAPSLGFVPQTVNPLAPTILFLLDVPLLQDIDAPPAGSTGYYFAMSAAGLGWPGGVLLYSVDNATWNQAGFSKDLISFGAVSAALPAPRSPWDWDDVNTITVFMIEGSLSSTSDLNVLNGANAALLGDEVIQFGTAILNADGSYTLSHLLRGRRGSELSCGTHSTGETFIYLNSGLHRNTIPTSQIGILGEYRATTVGASVTNAQSQALTPAGNDLKPYAPTSVAGSRDVSNNLTITWIRRTRIGGAWLDGTGTVPLGEDSELYSIDILNGSTVIRTIDGLAAPTAGYSAAQQTADFGSAQSSIAIRVYQISAQVGRGFPAAVNV